jgi:hypothetical protein
MQLRRSHRWHKVSRKRFYHGDPHTFPVLRPGFLWGELTVLQATLRALAGTRVFEIAINGPRVSANEHAT